MITKKRRELQGPTGYSSASNSYPAKTLQMDDDLQSYYSKLQLIARRIPAGDGGSVAKESPQGLQA
jgi:hypothetical protein